MALLFIRQISARGQIKYFQITNRTTQDVKLPDVEWDGLIGWQFYKPGGSYIWRPGYARDIEADKRYRVCELLPAGYQQRCSELFPLPVSVDDYSSELFARISRHMVELFVFDLEITLEEFVTADLTDLLAGTRVKNDLAIEELQDDLSGDVLEDDGLITEESDVVVDNQIPADTIVIDDIEL